MGCVYILKNERIPNVTKFGCTERDAEKRAAELSSPTGVPGRWTVAFSWEVEDPFGVEKLVFGSLRAHRIEDQEFFALSPSCAKELIDPIITTVRREELTKLSARLMTMMEEPALREAVLSIQREIWGKEEARREQDLRLREAEVLRVAEDTRRRASEAAAASQRRRLEDLVLQIETALIRQTDQVRQSERERLATLVSIVAEAPQSAPPVVAEALRSAPRQVQAPVFRRPDRDVVIAVVGLFFVLLLVLVVMSARLRW